MSKTISTRYKQIRRQLGKNWLPFNLFYIDRRPDKVYKRASIRTVQLTRKTNLVLHLRDFKLKKGQRKKYFLAIRVPRIYTSRLREIDFEIRKQKVRGRPKTKKVDPNRIKKIAYGVAMIVAVAGVIVSLSALKSESGSNVLSSSAVIPVQDTETVVNKDETFLPKSKPVRLQISSIGVDSKTISVAKEKDGTMETPKSDSLTGWYKYSPSPGQQGPAVIVGHVDWIDGPAVFYRLREIKKGAVVKVERADGKTVKYKVTGKEEYSQSKFPTKKVYGNTEDSQLRLITCSGVFDRSTYSYNNNIVVYAKKV